MKRHHGASRVQGEHTASDSSPSSQVKLYKTFIDTAPVAIAMFDRQMRYLAASNRWKRDYHLADADIVGQCHYEIFPEISELWKAVHRRGLAGEVIRAEEDRFERLDGTVQWLRWEVRPWRGDDGGISVGGITIYSEDITERKLIEERQRVLIRQAEEAAETAYRANAAKSRFMAAASHDLRQPLVPIKLLAELLATEIGQTPHGAMVYKLRNAVQSLDDLLNKMMAFSRLEAGAVSIRIENVRLGEVLERFHQEFSPVAEAKGLILRRVRTQAVVRTDRVLMELILRNLVENAIRYTRTGKVLIGCRRKGDHIRLCVCDTGLGIASEEQENVFTEFFQGNAQGGDGKAGLGLGLATVERLSRLLDTPVDMRSTLGKGSCFGVSIPRSEAGEVAPSPSEKRAPPDPGPLRILLIEDDKLVQDGVVDALLRRGWEPTVASSVREAMDIVLSEGPPDAIITDLRLAPCECGLDAITAIHGIAGRDVASVIITGDASHHRLAEAMGSACPILVKPFSAGELYTVVAETVLKARAAAAAVSKSG